jgi:hypothetical protein
MLPGASIFPHVPIVLTALGTRRGFLRESAAIPAFGHKGHAVLPLCANGYRLAKGQGKPNPATDGNLRETWVCVILQSSAPRKHLRAIHRDT